MRVSFEEDETLIYGDQLCVDNCYKMDRKRSRGRRHAGSLLMRGVRNRLLISFGVALSAYIRVEAFSSGVSNVFSVAIRNKAVDESSFTLASTRDGIREMDSNFAQNFVGQAPESKEIRQRVVSFLKEGNFESAQQLILGMLDFLRDESGLDVTVKEGLCMSIDEALQLCYNTAFVPPYRGSPARSRIASGVKLLYAQLSHQGLATPYNQIPKPVLVSALKALTGLNEVISMDSGEKLDNADAAFRILQRLVTGVGVRNTVEGAQMRLFETDFNIVLNAYTKIGRMDMAHRVIALQERSPNAPLLSPVAFSILLKGYGKLRDMLNIEMLLNHAESVGVESDTIMMNSLVDAYINCGAFDKAQEVFDFMKHPKENHFLPNVYPQLFKCSTCPSPNKRTYNIILKGLASRANLDEAVALSQEMEALNLWDHVTTNTLVQAAVKAHDFHAANDFLDRYTVSVKKATRGSHPNAEAYTSVIDGLAKRGDMQSALDALKRMKARGVDPNRYTYTSVVGALAKNKMVETARKMMKFMKEKGHVPRVETYNAFISGLVHREGTFADPSYDQHINEAIAVLREMMANRIRPNAVTVSVLLGGFGNCNCPRVVEASALVDKLEGDGIIPSGNSRIYTALIRVFAAGGDFDGAMERFHRIRKPDIAAVNAIIDVCVQVDKDAIALEIFRDFVASPRQDCRPDVITYSCLIKSALKRVDYAGAKEARKFYEEMKYRRRIMPDIALVDVILKKMIQFGQNGSMLASDVRFVAGVLRDAETLEWPAGQLERRKQAVKKIMTGRIAGTWAEESDLYGLGKTNDYEDEIFKKHGWNKVDSGFRLWGSQSKQDGKTQRPSDKFLQSKGWNNVDSGFRII